MEELRTPLSHGSRRRGCRAQSKGVGLALAPIGGGIATFGLYLPFYFAAGVALIALVIVILFLKDADEILELQARDRVELEPPRAPPRSERAAYLRTFGTISRGSRGALT